MYCLFYACSAGMPRTTLTMMANYINKLKRSNAAHISVYAAWTHLQIGKKVAAIVRSQHRGAASHQRVGPCTNLNISKIYKPLFDPKIAIFSGIKSEISFEKVNILSFYHKNSR
jgi:hypothetical protein